MTQRLLPLLRFDGYHCWPTSPVSRTSTAAFGRLSWVCCRTARSLRRTKCSRRGPRDDRLLGARDHPDDGAHAARPDRGGPRLSAAQVRRAQGRGRSGAGVERRLRPRRRGVHPPGARGRAGRPGLCPHPRPDRDPDVPGFATSSHGSAGSGGRGRHQRPPWSRRSPRPGGRIPATTSRSSRGRTASSPASWIHLRRNRPSRLAPWPGPQRRSPPFPVPRGVGAAAQVGSRTAGPGRNVPGGRRPADEVPPLCPGARPHRRQRAREPCTDEDTWVFPFDSRFRPRRVPTRPFQSPRTTDR